MANKWHIPLLWLLALRSLCMSFESNESSCAAAQAYAVGAMPSVTYSLPSSWAGQIGIPDTADDKLFFWLFETEIPSQNDNLISNLPLGFDRHQLISSLNSLVERRSWVYIM